MSSEYRFLRFEIVGIATLVFLTMGILPILKYETLQLVFSDVSAAVAFFGSLLVASLPLGYWEHQLVVNVYRSPGKRRKAFGIIEECVTSIEEQRGGKAFFASMEDIARSAFLTSLLEVCMFHKDSKIESTIYDRLGDRWSHFYARRAVGCYAPLVSLLLFFVLVVVTCVYSPSSIAVEPRGILASIAFWSFIFAFSKLAIDSYARKLWEEINHLEAAIVLANLDMVKNTFESTVEAYIKNPELAKKDESYGIAIWKM